MATDSTKVAMRGDALFTTRPWPVRVENPGKFRWAVYRDGALVGGCRTLREALNRINSGLWDAVEQSGTVEEKTDGE